MVLLRLTQTTTQICVLFQDDHIVTNADAPRDDPAPGVVEKDIAKEMNAEPVTVEEFMETEKEEEKEEEVEVANNVMDEEKMD